MMTSAYLPKYLPADLIQFTNTRGENQVLFATRRRARCRSGRGCW